MTTSMYDETMDAMTEDEFFVWQEAMQASLWRELLAETAVTERQQQEPLEPYSDDEIPF